MFSINYTNNLWFIISIYSSKLIIALYSLICYTLRMITLPITTSKNLLAFSGGIDSTALFFLMVEQNIPFDIAIVDYNQREQSKDEVIYATQLAHKYKKQCFISTFPKEQTFNEKSARDFRYKFFDTLMKEHGFESLLTAHQLNDKLEWFLMQFSRGAGLSELLGVTSCVDKNSYKILRPLLELSKEQLQTYLQKNNYKYFEDESNLDQNYTRNYFRHNFSDKFIKEFHEGVVKSFEYLHNDQQSLLYNIDKKVFKELHIYNFNGDLNIAINIIDKDLKQRGILLTKKSRDEILEKKELVISHKIAVAIVENTIYIAPYLQSVMDKEFKEKCRTANIPKHIRPYIYTLENFTF